MSGACKKRKMDPKPDDNDDDVTGTNQTSNAKLEELQKKVEELQKKVEEVNLLLYKEWFKGLKLETELNKSKALITAVPESLTKSSFPAGWLDDDRVRQAVIRSGDRSDSYGWSRSESGYTNLPHELKCDARMVQSAIDYYSGRDRIHYNVGWRDKIPQEAKEDPDVVLAAMSNEDCGVEWESIPQSVQQNARVAWKAIARRLVTRDRVPFVLESTENVLIGKCPLA